MLLPAKDKEEGLRFAIYTLGCKVNQEEAAAMAGIFLKDGFCQVDFEDEADVYVINTCTVTHLADRKSRAMIRRARRRNEQALVVVTGCYAQVSADELLKLTEVDLVAGVGERAILPQLVRQQWQNTSKQAENSVRKVVSDIQESDRFVPISSDVSAQNRVRAYLKIEDGCDQFCHYCIVPYARGPVRSLPMEQAVLQAVQLIAAGHKEIVLTGIHIGAYGQDLPHVDHTNLVTLTQKLVKLDGLVRLRFSSLEPHQINEDLIALLREEKKICPHLHIPLQSGCDRTLKNMGRRYDTGFYADLINRLRQAVPNIAVTTDVMVGYPQETDEDFQASYDFCRRMAFADMHVFPYSQRKGTVAAGLSGQVLPQQKADRAVRLADLANSMADAYASSFLDKSLTILPEQAVDYQGKKMLQGHSDEYLLVMFFAPDHLIGQEVKVLAKSLSKDCILGELIR